MIRSSQTLRTGLMAGLIFSGQALAQGLPDEINHPQYLKIYQSLEEDLLKKSQDLEKLKTEKSQIVHTINQMEKDWRELPGRNDQLRRLIATKEAELQKLDNEIMGLEGVLSKIIDDLKRLDAMINQLQRDLGEESQRHQALQVQRHQTGGEFNRQNARLQQEIREEQQSMQLISRLDDESNSAHAIKANTQQERMQLTQDVNRFKTEVVKQRTLLLQSQQMISSHKTKLTDSETKLSQIKVTLQSEEAKLKESRNELAPHAKKLQELKSELARLMPDVARLQKENQDLKSKMSDYQVRIETSGVNDLQTRKKALEDEVANIHIQLKDSNEKLVAAQEALKADLGKENELRTEIRRLQRERSSSPELHRLQNELNALEKQMAPKRAEILRLTKESERLATLQAPKNSELKSLESKLSEVLKAVDSYKKEIAASEAKINANDKIINEQMSSNAELARQLREVEAQVSRLEPQIIVLTKNISQLKQQESSLSQETSSLKISLQKMEAENSKMAKSIAEMDQAINDYPQNIRRLELRMAKQDEIILQKKHELNREQKLLHRIRQDRVTIEREVAIIQRDLGLIDQNLSQSERVSRALQQKLQEESKTRDALTRYNQDSIRKYDSLKQQRAAALKTKVDSLEEVSFNEEDLVTIGRELPQLKKDLIQYNSKIDLAERSLVEVQKKTMEANSQYQRRSALYNDYLNEAKSLGQSGAKVGTSDGVKAGSSEARIKATKLAVENGSSEARWEALRRGYVRGEIAGYEEGLEIGLSSRTDLQRGVIEGKTSGARRARDHAEMVLKPEFYTAELSRRLGEEKLLKQKVTFKFDHEVNGMVFGPSPKQDIPDLTPEELKASSMIISSLDKMIEQSLFEIKEVLKAREKLADGNYVYAEPAPGENARKANCIGVYKNVKDFLEACRGAYEAQYGELYQAAFENTFKREYNGIFSSQVEKVFSTELNRLYPVYYRDASSVSKEVGISAGKKEIYQQSFARAEIEAYALTLPGEEARVERESAQMVNEFLKSNSALTLQGSVKLKSGSHYGVAPGVEADLLMMIKNVGMKSSSGDSLFRIREVSPSLVIDKKEGFIGPIAAKSLSEVKTLKVKVSDSAQPGSAFYLAGEIVHPGNDYKSQRIESFTLNGVLGINPEIDMVTDFDASPRVSSRIFGATKKHEIGLSIKPKYAGVDEGYEVSIEEMGSSYVSFSQSKISTERLMRGALAKVDFDYRLEKMAKGKTIVLKVRVTNDGRPVKEIDLTIKPD